MNINGASLSAAELALAQEQQTNVALLKKVQDVTKAEGQAAIELIEQAAQGIDDVGVGEGGLDIVV